MNRIFNLVQNQRQVFLIIYNFDLRFYIIVVLQDKKIHKSHHLLPSNRIVKTHFNNNK